MPDVRERIEAGCGDVPLLFSRPQLPPVTPAFHWRKCALVVLLCAASGWSAWAQSDPTPAYYDAAIGKTGALLKAALRTSCGDNLSILSHQVVFDRAERNLCLSEPAHQDAVTRLCEEQGHKVVFLGNQSTLITLVRENSGTSRSAISAEWHLLSKRVTRTALMSGR